LLSDYLDLELPPEACRDIEKHLEGCPPCAEFAARLRRMIVLCRTHQPAVQPGPLRKGARAELEGAWRKMLAARRQGG
jgi:anti-sigma factor RsiW